jgi:hypothetical protein
MPVSGNISTVRAWTIMFHGLRFVTGIGVRGLFRSGRLVNLFAAFIGLPKKVLSAIKLSPRSDSAVHHN